MTDVTADVFLGLGIGCARCHDHKFDPILQKDYYRLQAFFAPSCGATTCRRPRREVAEYQRKLAAWEAKTADIRRQMDEIEDRSAKRRGSTTLKKFPMDMQAMFDKPDGERTPLEKQLVVPGDCCK